VVHEADPIVDDGFEQAAACLATTFRVDFAEASIWIGDVCGDDNARGSPS